MKNSIKIITLLFVSVFAYSNANAQASGTENVGVDAVVVGNLTTNLEESLNFGQILAGVTANVDSDGTATDADLGAGFTVGEVSISGDNSADVSITFNDAAVTQGNLTYTPELSYLAGTGDRTTGGTAVIATGAVVALDTNGVGRVFVGGEMDATGASSGDTFTATLAVTISYN